MKQHQKRSIIFYFIFFPEKVALTELQHLWTASKSEPLSLKFLGNCRFKQNGLL